MDPTLSDLLRRCSSGDATNHTHLTSFGLNQKWSVSDNQWEAFWQGYCDIVASNMNLSVDKGKRGCFLAERPRRYMPLIAELTLKFHPLDSDGGETYGHDFMLAVVFCYQQVMLQELQIGAKCTELICCVLESNDYIEDNLVVTQLRLQFPYCKIPASVQKRRIRDNVIKLLHRENVIGRLPQTPIGDWETIINPLTTEQPCVMYGSKINPDVPYLQLEFILPKIEYECIDRGAFKSFELEEVFKYHYHEHVSNTLVSSNMFSRENDCDYWLPMFLSLGYWEEIVKAKPEKQEQAINIRSVSNSSRGHLYPSTSSSSKDEDTKESMAERFLAMLGRERCELEHFWQDVGKSLYTVYNGEQRGLDLWISFSEKSDVFTPKNCNNKYLSFFGNNLDERTLAWYARQDSYEEYERWHRSWYLPALEKATSCLHSDVADALYRVYWLEFVCSGLNENDLYFYHNHVWKKLDNAVTLRKFIRGDFLSLFEHLRTQISLKVQGSTDNSLKDSAELMIKKIGNVISKLKTRSFKKNLVSEVLERFYVEELEVKLDSDATLMGMVNGIVEAGDREAVIREGKPQDYISRSTGIMWRYDLHDKHPLVQRVKVWMNKVFPDQDLRRYATKLFASCIRGKNSEKIFPILTGAGDNSKSMIKKLFEATFGSYCITFSTAIFTSKRQGGGPQPEIARAKATRVAFLQEPDSDDSMRNGVVKEMTGGDRFFARMCNQNGSEIEAMFKLFLMCNHVPIIPHSDKAIKNRVRILPFLSTWVKNAPKDDAERYKQKLFQMDPCFEDKIPEMAPAFLWYLVKRYRAYKKEGLKQPQIIDKHTEDYWKENDVYIQFVKENIEIARKDIHDWPEDKPLPVDNDAKIKVTDVYVRFKDWFRDIYPGLKCPDRPVAKAELVERLKQKPVGNCWYAYKFKITVAEI